MKGMTILTFALFIVSHCFFAEAGESQNVKIIPEGIFTMGMKHQLQSEEGMQAAQPIHKVHLNSFLIDKYEVTQEEYQKLMNCNPAATKRNLNNMKELKNKNAKGPVVIVGGKYPVTNVSWYEAARYCNARSKAEGLEPCYDEKTWQCDFTKNGYRLPTEAEWEYACRAGTNTIYYFGNDRRKLSEYANFWPDKYEWQKAFLDADISNPTKVFKWNKPVPTLLPVGSKKPNNWGIYDMLGNVLEWCNDWYDNAYYKRSPFDNPSGPKGAMRDKVVRGGSFTDYFMSCALRIGVSPDTDIGIGFRCVRNAPKEEKKETEKKDVKDKEPGEKSKDKGEE